MAFTNALGGEEKRPGLDAIRPVGLANHGCGGICSDVRRVGGV